VALNILDGHPRQRRLVGLALTAVAIEIGLLLVAWFGPAFRVLLRPIYVLVATIFIWMIWRSARRRSDGDRRQEERRHSSP
jgi:Flp pilus assembly protein TadB